MDDPEQPLSGEDIEKMFAGTWTPSHVGVADTHIAAARSRPRREVDEHDGAHEPTKHIYDDPFEVSCRETHWTSITFPAERVLNLSIPFCL